MKRWPWLVIIVVSLLLFGLKTIGAQGESLPSESTDQIPSFQKPELSSIAPKRSLVNPLGQNHRYTVTFRGNGEAVVAMRVTLSNTEKQPLPSVELRVPKVLPEEIAAFQVIKEPVCIRYAEPELLGQTYEQKPSPPLRCLEYQPIEYYPDWGEPISYRKAQVELSGDTLTITLPQSVKKDESGSFLLVFRARGYAKKDLFGIWRFSFETLKAQEAIRELQVGITTDADLVLRSGRGKVEYRFAEVLETAKLGGVTAESFRYPIFDEYYHQIGWGEIVKKATNLQALDSYVVKGSYADSWFQVYAKEVIGGVVILLLFAISFILILRRLFAASHVAATSPQGRQPSATDIGLVVLLSFLAAVFAIAYTFLLWFLLQWIGTDVFREGAIFFLLILLIFSLGVYALLLVTPALILGLRRGLGWGLAAAGATVGWILLALVVLSVALLALNRTGPITPPIYLEKLFPGANPPPELLTPEEAEEGASTK